MGNLKETGLGFRPFDFPGMMGALVGALLAPTYDLTNELVCGIVISRSNICPRCPPRDPEKGLTRNRFAHFTATSWASLGIRLWARSTAGTL